MSWGAIIGGVVGAAVGGPVGAAIGAAIGAGAEAMGGEDAGAEAMGGQAPSILSDATPISDITWENWEGDGSLLRVVLPTGSRAWNVIVRAKSFDGSYYYKGVSPRWQDSDGDFAASQQVTDSMGDEVFVFIPMGGIMHAPSSQLLEIVAIGGSEQNPRVVASGSFEVQLPRGTYSEARFWQPLLAILMKVARADGSLNSAEMRVVGKIVREGLEIPNSESSEVKQILRAHDDRPIADHLSRLLARMQSIDLFSILQAMAEVAHADGVIDPGEVTVMRQVAECFGLDQAAWNDLAQQLGLDAEDKHEEWTQLLGLDQEYSEQDVKKAYRSKMMEYHPDKYQRYPEEFRAVAQRMAIRLTEARDGLMATLD